MRKIIFCVLILISILLSGCKDDPYKTALNSSDVAAKVIGDKSAVCSIYVGYGYETDSFTKNVMEKLYGTTDVARYCTDYTAVISNGDCVWEAHFFRLTSLYDAKKVKRILEKRIELKSREEIYDYIGERVDALIVGRKNMICLFITENNAHYSEMLKRIC